MSDDKRSVAGIPVPAESMPAMLGLPFVADAPDLGMDPAGRGGRLGEAWRTVAAAMPRREHVTSAQQSPADRSARAAVAELFATRAIPIAALAFAAMLGATLGAFGTIGVSHLASEREPKTALASAAEVSDLIEQLARLKGELAALKGTVETANKKTSGEVAKLTDKVERNERRLTLATASQETTGSIAQPKPAAPAAATTPLPSPAPPAIKPPLVEGWRLRGVVEGVAILDSRFGPAEVIPGDLLPGGLRVENIQRREGRWVVVTNRGLITSR